MSKIILGIALAFGLAGSAAAASPCGGEAPAAGTEIHGPVLHVLDGRTLCVAQGADPSRWTQVVLDDAPASASWGGLMSAAFGKDVICIVSLHGRSAICRVEGRPLGPQLNAASASKEAAAWRKPASEPATPIQVATAGS